MLNPDHILQDARKCIAMRKLMITWPKLVIIVYEIKGRDN